MDTSLTLTRFGTAVVVVLALGCAGKNSSASDTAHGGSAQAGAGTGGGGRAGSGTNTGGSNAGATNTGGANSGGSSAGGSSAASTGGSGGASTGGAGGASTGGAGTSGLGGAGTGGSTAGSYIACANPSPVLLAGKDTGFVSCGAGVVHRASVVACPSLLPRANGGSCTFGSGAAGAPCALDADCAQKPNGTCNHVTTGHLPSCACDYGCLSDQDCASGEICECSDPVGQCRAADCTTDASCPAGSQCASAADDFNGCSSYASPRVFKCQSSADTCLTDQTCSSPSTACAFDGDAGTRDCRPSCPLTP
ncbi:MAG TPA: hypothetical protein VGI10_22365 [Polyangiaceae bacterium]